MPAVSRRSSPRKSTPTAPIVRARAAGQASCRVAIWLAAQYRPWVYSFEGNRLRIHHTGQAGKGVLETVGVRLLAQIRAKILAEDEFVAVLPGTPRRRLHTDAVARHFAICCASVSP